MGTDRLSKLSYRTGWCYALSYPIFCSIYSLLRPITKSTFTHSSSIFLGEKFNDHSLQKCPCELSTKIMHSSWICSAYVNKPQTLSARIHEDYPFYWWYKTSGQNSYYRIELLQKSTGDQLDEIIFPSKWHERMRSVSNRFVKLWRHTHWKSHEIYIRHTQVEKSSWVGKNNDTQLSIRGLKSQFRRIYFGRNYSTP